MTFIKSLVALAAATAFGLASAATTTFTQTGSDPITPPAEQATLTFDGVNAAPGYAPAEFYGTNTNPAGSFAAFCLEPRDHLANPGDYTLGTFAPGVANALSKLFTGANWKSWDYLNDGVTTGLQRFGLGLAVWDIAMDGTLDFNSGNFRVLDDGHGGAATAFANAAYAAGDFSMASSLIWLQAANRENQDLVIAVPEPSTYALMLAGLLGIGFVARRRTTPRD